MEEYKLSPGIKPLGLFTFRNKTWDRATRHYRSNTSRRISTCSTKEDRQRRSCRRDVPLRINTMAGER